MPGAVDVLGDQQFEVTLESATEIGCRQWSDLDDAQALLDAEGIACERAEKTAPRMGPRAPQPQR